MAIRELRTTLWQEDQEYQLQSSRYTPQPNHPPPPAFHIREASIYSVRNNLPEGNHDNIQYNHSAAQTGG
jgi:hypothetical protein